MADIFISYSKADHPLALKLSAFLEAEGWTVWWDKSLAAADLYRDEIMKQLAAARAVITIWTENSIKSDWVRAEAGTAKKEGKLIPVKTADVAYADIPLPFGEMHTENVGSTDLIRAAVVAQLAKPAVEPAAWALLGKGLKWELLSWWGIIGGAITLFVAISTTLKLADWARVLVEHWNAWTHAFWVWAFGWLGIHLPWYWTDILSFLLFGSLLAVGQAVKFNRTNKSQPIVDKYQGKSFKLISWRTLFWLILTVIIVWWSHTITSWLLIFEAYLPNFVQDLLPMFLIFAAPVLLLIIFARYRLDTTVAVFLIVVFWTIINLAGDEEEFHAEDMFAVIIPSLIGFAMIPVLSLILLSVAPAKAVSRRLIFLALGLLLLIGLNELSKLGLDVTAPKQG